MRQTILIVTLGILFGFWENGHCGVSAEKEREIRKLLDASGAKKSLIGTIDQTINAFRKGLPSVPDEFWDGFKGEMDVEELVTLMVPIYDKHLSLDDLKAANSFYATPAGKHLAEQQPMMTSEGFEIGRKWGEDKGKLVVERLRAKGLLK